jgi:hypothetical protein
VSSVVKPYMTTRWYLLPMVLFVAMGVLIVVWPRFLSKQEDIENLPAVVRLRKYDDRNSIVAIRLLPSKRHRASEMKCLGRPAVLEKLEAFDAVDCSDFGDQGLRFLSAASHLELLSLDGTTISDDSLKHISRNFPSLQVLAIEGCSVSEQAVIDMLSERQLRYLRLSEEYDRPEFCERVRKVSPLTIVMCGGQDIMEQPESAFELIPWDRW